MRAVPVSGPVIDLTTRIRCHTTGTEHHQLTPTHPTPSHSSRVNPLSVVLIGAALLVIAGALWQLGRVEPVSWLKKTLFIRLIGG